MWQNMIMNLRKNLLEKGEEVQTMVYIIRDKVEDEEIYINLPSEEYLNLIKIGYKAAGFDMEFLEEAFKVSINRKG